MKVRWIAGVGLQTAGLRDHGRARAGPDVDLLVRQLFQVPRPRRALSALLGVDEEGRAVWMDFRDPRSAHALIVGAEGTGKSELLRTIVVSLGMCARPSEVNIAAVDPTGRELRIVEALPHALSALAEHSCESEELLTWLSDEARRRLIRRQVRPEVIVLLESPGVEGRRDVGRRPLEDVLRLGPLCGFHVIAAQERAQAGIPWTARTRVIEAFSGRGPGWFRLLSDGAGGTLFYAARLSAADLDRAVRWMRGERGGYRGKASSTPGPFPAADNQRVLPGGHDNGGST